MSDIASQPNINQSKVYQMIKSQTMPTTVGGMSRTQIQDLPSLLALNDLISLASCFLTSKNRICSFGWASAWKRLRRLCSYPSLQLYRLRFKFSSPFFSTRCWSLNHVVVAVTNGTAGKLLSVMFIRTFDSQWWLTYHLYRGYDVCQTLCGISDSRPILTLTSEAREQERIHGDGRQVSEECLGHWHPTICEDHRYMAWDNKIADDCLQELKRGTQENSVESLGLKKVQSTRWLA
jgi:hypothetical protein